MNERPYNQRRHTMYSLIKILNDKIFNDDPLINDNNGYGTWSKNLTYSIVLNDCTYEFSYRTYNICEIPEEDLDINNIDQIVKSKFIDLCNRIEESYNSKIIENRKLKNRIQKIKC